MCLCVMCLCVCVCVHTSVCVRQKAGSDGQRKHVPVCVCTMHILIIITNLASFSPLPMQAVSDERIESPAFVTLSTACTLSLQCLFDNRCEEVLSPNCYCKKKKKK